MTLSQLLKLCIKWWDAGMNGELESILNEVLVVCFKMVSLHLLGGIEENREQPHSLVWVICGLWLRVQ
jgi:hypothetical protein